MHSAAVQRRKKGGTETHRSGIEAVFQRQKTGGKCGGLEADEKRPKADELPEHEAAAKRLEAAEFPERESGCKAAEIGRLNFPPTPAALS